MAPRTNRIWVVLFFAGTTPALAEWEGLPMPESPAAAAIGTADSTILKPATAKDLAASLIRVASRGGKITSGINLEFAPSTLLRGTRYKRGTEYSSTSVTAQRFGPFSASLPFSLDWIWTNTTVSLATGAKEGSSTSTDKLALGLKVPLYDHADPRLGASRCYHSLDADAKEAKTLLAAREAARANALTATSATAAEAAVADFNVRATARLRNCMALNQVAWNAPSAALAFAQVWTDLGTQDQARLTRDAHYAWFSMASPLGTPQTADPKPGQMQLIVQAKLARDVVDTTKTVAAGAKPIRYRGDGGAMRFRAGEEKLNVDLSGSIERRRYTDGSHENVKLGALGLELKVMDNLWLKLSLGYERKDITGGNPFVNTSVKWGTNKDSDGTYLGINRALAPETPRPLQ